VIDRHYAARRPRGVASRARGARAATAADTSLLPSGHDMRLLVRYASMNDRKIERLLKLIEKHCRQPAENDA